MAIKDRSWVENGLRELYRAANSPEFESASRRDLTESERRYCAAEAWALQIFAHCRVDLEWASCSGGAETEDEYVARVAGRVIRMMEKFDSIRRDGGCDAVGCEFRTGGRIPELKGMIAFMDDADVCDQCLEVIYISEAGMARRAKRKLNAEFVSRWRGPPYGKMTILEHLDARAESDE